MCTIFASAPCMCDGTIFNFTHSIYTLLCCFFKMADGLCHTIGIGYDRMKCGWKRGRVESMYCIIWGLFPSTSQRFLLAPKCGWKDWRKIIISLTILIFYVWIFVFTYSAIWRSFNEKRKLFLAFNFRVDMLDLASHSTLSAHPFLLMSVRVWVPEFTSFLFFQPRSVHKWIVFFSWQNESYTMFGMTMKNEIAGSFYPVEVGIVRSVSNMKFFQVKS